MSEGCIQEKLTRGQCHRDIERKQQQDHCRLSIRRLVEMTRKKGSVGFECMAADNDTSVGKCGDKMHCVPNLSQQPQRSNRLRRHHHLSTFIHPHRLIVVSLHTPSLLT
jgi:hypothetical protein